MVKQKCFHFILGKKTPQIHCHVICLHLVWTACMAHNLAVITNSSELELQQEDKYNIAITA